MEWILFSQGAVWGQGPKIRGEAVSSRPKKVCPGQLPNGVATTLRTSWLLNAIRGLQEMLCFHSQILQPGPRLFIQRRTIVNTRARLARLRAPGP